MKMATPALDEVSLEKGTKTPEDTSSRSSDEPENVFPASSGLLASWNSRVSKITYLEERGIQRVLPKDRYELSTASYVQMTLLWFSANLTANNLAVALLGPLVYGLSFTDAALCSVFGGIVGSAGAAYMSTWGPASGNRTMVRFEDLLGREVLLIA